MEQQSCLITGIFGIGMLCAAFSCMSISEEQRYILRKKLSPELDDIHSRIVIERRNLYFQGILIGLLLSYILLKIYKTFNTFHRVSFVMAITTLTSVIYYFLMPKSDYMLKHLKTPAENKAWLDIYTFMKQRYFLGFLFGSLAAIPLSYSMCYAI